MNTQSSLNSEFGNERGGLEGGGAGEVREVDGGEGGGGGREEVGGVDYQLKVRGNSEY